MKVAAIQMVSTPDLPTNLQAAARQGAELAVLPEYFCVMGLKDTDKLALQEPFGNGPIQRFLSVQASALGHRRL